MIIYTLPVEFEGKIIGPSKPIEVVSGGKLVDIEVGQAVRLEDAEFKVHDDRHTLYFDNRANLSLSRREPKAFKRVTGTTEPNPRGRLKDATIVVVWQRTN